MGGSSNAALDARAVITPADTARSAPGKRTLTDRLPAPGARGAPARGVDLPGEDRAQDGGAPTRDALVSIELGRHALIDLKVRMRRGELSAAAAAEAATQRLEIVADAVGALVAHHHELHPTGVEGFVHGLTVITSGRHDEDPNVARALPFLDSITADALEIARAVDDPAVQRRLALALDSATRAAAPLGYQRPPDLDAARTRKFAVDACPAQETESPRRCELGPARDRTLIELRTGLDAIVDAFFAACQQRISALQGDIDRDRRLATFIAGAVVDILVGAITGPVGVSVSRGLRAGASDTASAGIGAAAATTATAARNEAGSTLSPIVDDIGKTLRRSVTKAPEVVSRAGVGDDPRARTVGMLTALHQAVRARIDEIGVTVASLDDAQLLELTRRVQNYDATRIDRFVAQSAQAYQQQVAPIGIENEGSEHLFEGGWYRGDKKATGRAVRVVMPDGGERLALVDEITDKHPAVTHAARRGAVVAERALSREDDDLFTGRMTRDRQDAWVETPAEELHFVRWIDDPRMQALAGSDARRIPAARVQDLPMTSLLPAITDDSADARAPGGSPAAITHG